MKRFVLDASVSMAWFLDRPMPPLAAHAKHSLMSGDRAVVPALWHLEMANGIVLAERRRLLETAEADQYLLEIEQLQVGVIDTSSESVSLRQIVTTARLFQLTAYDAFYLDVARREQLPLATLDRALREAAVRSGVQLFA